MLKKLFRRFNLPVSVKRDSYTMTMQKNKKAEIELCGVIVNRLPAYRETEGETKGNYIVLGDFLKDLNKISKAKELTIRVNFIGGNAHTAICIYKKLKELNARKTIIVNGLVLSSGSLIMCAADVVKISESSRVKLHFGCPGMQEAFTGSDLRKVISSMDAADKSIVAIYKHKTGMSEGDILALMVEGIYLTGVEAIEKGFADELTDDNPPEITASADLRTLYINGMPLNFEAPIVNLPDGIRINNQDNEIFGKNRQKDSQRAGKANKCVEKPNKNKCSSDGSAPDKAEQKRLAELDQIASLYGPEIIYEAKYGENKCTAQELALAFAKKATQKREKFSIAIMADYEASGAANVEFHVNEPDLSRELTAEEKMVQGQFYARRVRKKTSREKN